MKVEEEVQSKEPRKQKKSVSYAIQALTTHIKTIQEGGFFDEKDARSLHDITKRAKEKFVKEKYGIG